MVKAKINMKNGTRVTLEGSENELKKILNALSIDSIDGVRKKETTRRRRKLTISDGILEMKEEGFFDIPRSLVEIKGALSEKGMIYEITTLSTQVLRQVRKRNLGRVKDGKRWKYVKR